MRTSSAKAKGRRLQDKVCRLLLESFTELEEDDIKPAIMGESGEDVKLSPAARKLLPYSIECKNQERLSIWTALEQAEENSKGFTPILIFKRNHSKTYATIEVEKLIKLIRKVM